ncbi:voltage-dependent calcium channel type A subunit alpha-1-like [Tachypleus tridentatus]|uniref:voltage-dependent calcium channel type A subunit alpha-1-like n=1 Tax=Tachypleus tridentatus TaxID=6853 RepID=UPI003FCF6344
MATLPGFVKQFPAVVTAFTAFREFAKERERVENRQAFLKLRQQQQLERELNGYVEWICKAEEVILAEERTTEEEKMHIIEARRKAAAKRKKMKNLHSKSTDEDDEDEIEDDVPTKKVRLKGLARASYFKAKVRNKGACKAFWRSEKRFRFFNSTFGEDAGVLLGCNSARVFKHSVCSHRTLQPASVAHRFFM